jgi:hypothetical protein
MPTMKGTTHSKVPWGQGRLPAGFSEGMGGHAFNLERDQLATKADGRAQAGSRGVESRDTDSEAVPGWPLMVALLWDAGL